MDVSTVIVLFVGVLIRLGTFYLVPNLSKVLDQFVMFSTPVNSYRSLNEGIFLLSNNLNPYTNGEIIHHPPILLWLFKILKESNIEDNFNTDLFYSLMDLLMCLQLIKINRKVNGKDGFSSLKIACFHMFNPFTLLTTFSKSTHIINNLLVISVSSCLVQDKFEAAIILLGLSSYLTYYSWYLLIPICYYLYVNKGISKVIKTIILFSLTLSVLIGISYKLSDDSFNFINLCYSTILRFKKITPNSGLWWYFFTEIFEFFNDFYLAVFNIYGLIFVLPLSIRFIKSYEKMNLLFVLWICVGLINFAKSYPIFADYTLFYSSIFLFKKYYSNLKFSPVIDYLFLYVVLLQAPTFYVVWMVLSSGNANFFYAIGLTLALLESIILSDFIWSFIQSEYYLNHKLDTKEDNVPPKLTQI